MPAPSSGDRPRLERKSLMRALAQQPLRKQRSLDPDSARQAPNRTLLVLGLGLLGFVLAQTAVVPALGRMERDFGASASDITWMVTAYLLVASIATPIFGRL